MINILLQVACYYFSFSLSKTIFYVDSSANPSGNGLTSKDPASNLHDAFQRASEDLEIVFMSCRQPYLIDKAYELPNSIDVTVNISCKPTLVLTGLGSLTFLSNVTLRNLIITGTPADKTGMSSESFFSFGGADSKLQRVLFGLEFKNIVLNQSYLLFGKNSFGTFNLINMIFENITVTSETSGMLINFLKCDYINTQTLKFNAVNLSNFGLIGAGCSITTDDLQIVSGLFKSSSQQPLILLTKDLILSNFSLVKNSFINRKIFEAGASSQITIDSALIYENTDNGISEAFFLYSQTPNTKVLIKNSEIINNYSPASYVLLESPDSMFSLFNVSIVKNAYAILFNLNGPNLTVSLKNVEICQNNKNSTNFYSLINASKIYKFTDFYGLAMLIKDYYSVSIINLTIVNNDASNNLQGIGFLHSENFIADLKSLPDQPEVNIKEFHCQGNKGYNMKSPTLMGNCIHLQAIGAVTLATSSFTSNELDVESNSFFFGASSPCIYSVFRTQIILIVIDSIFSENKGYDGCHCLTFIGQKFTIMNSNFTNSRSSKDSESISNKAGVLSIGASLVEIRNVFIGNCSAQKAAGILFQNMGNLKNIFVWSDGLIIRNNQAIQSAGIEFDLSLPNGLYIFNNSILDSNKVKLYGVVTLFFNANINVTFTNSKFLKNCGISAGSLFTLLNLLGDLYITGSSFFNNNLMGNQVFIGGGVALVYGSQTRTIIHFHRCSFYRNYCSEKAGAIAIHIGIAYIKDSIFEGNSAPIGGTIAVGYASKADIQNTSFIGNIQDVKIDEAAGLYLNDETFTILTECKFLKLSATSSAIIKLDGINAFVNIIFSYFFGNNGTQGNIIYLFSRLNLRVIYLKNCLFEKNFGFKDIIYAYNIKIQANNISALFNEGNLFALIKTDITINSFSIYNHICNHNGWQGCIASISLQSSIEFNQCSFQNIKSNFDRDFFIIKESNVLIRGLICSNLTSNSEFLLAYAFNSNLTLISISLNGSDTNLLYIENSFVVISNSSFSNIFHQILNKFKFGLIQCFVCLRFNASFSNFSFIKTNTFGGVFYLLNGLGNHDVFCINNNIFTNVSADYGAVIYLENQNLTFINNSAFNNKAAEKGGVAFLKTQYKAKIFWTFKANEFIMNDAKSGGCVHSMGNIPDGIFNNTFTSNTAIYGKDYSSFAARLTLEKMLVTEKNSSLLLTLNCSYIDESCRIRNVPSGLSLDNILVSIIDTYGQKMVLEETLGSIDLAYKFDYADDISSGGEDRLPELLSGPSHMTILKGLKTSKSYNGVFNFSELTLIATPKSRVVLMVKSDVIQNFMPEYIPSSSLSDLISKQTNQYNFLFILELRDCIRGEIFIPKENVCFPCPEGKYSLDKNDQQCKPCPANAYCEGRDRIIVDHGYWRSSVNSTVIWQCNTVSDPCLGGYDSLCKEGYTATLCGSCKFQNNASKFFKNGNFYCFPCDDLYKYTIVLIIGISLLVAALIFLVWHKQRKQKNIREGALIKLLINHLHIISFISSIKITLPDLLQNFYNFQTPVSSTETFVFAMDCFKDKFVIPVFAVKLILSVMMMIFIVLVICVVFFYIKVKTKKTLEETLISIINALVIVAMFLQPQFINFYVQMLSCVKYDQKFMANYMEQKCWEGDHFIYSIFLSVPMLVFWMIFYPASFLILMYKNRNNLNNQRILKLTIFFRAGFKQNLYFWEFVTMSRKFCVILITGFYGDDTEGVIYLLIPILAFYCALQIYVRPFIDASFNFLETFSLNASFITYYSAIFYLKVVSSGIKFFFLIIIIGVNFGFILLWIRQYIIKMRKMITERRKSATVIQKIRLPELDTEKNSVNVSPINRLELPNNKAHESSNEKIKCNFGSQLQLDENI